MNKGTRYKQSGHSTYRNKKWLYLQYVTKERSLRDIARECEKDHQNIRYWLHKHSIPLRRVGDFEMERASQWQGGQSPYSKEFNRSFKDKIRSRDNLTCQMCGIKQPDYKQRLDVHHIDYNKQNCSQENLISLCRKCHLRTNHGDRNEWITFFTFTFAMNE